MGPINAIRILQFGTYNDDLYKRNTKIHLERIFHNISYAGTDTLTCKYNIAYNMRLSSRSASDQVEQWSQSIHCSTWPLVDRELRRAKQMLINNGYSNSDFDMITLDMIGKYVTTPHTTQRTTRGTPDTISICYRSTLTPDWKKDEKVIRDTIRNNATPVQPEHIIGEGGETGGKFCKNCYISKSIVDQAAAVALLGSPFLSLSGYIIIFVLL